MDWTTIGVAATMTLGSFFAKGGESVAEKIGEDLYNWLQQWFEKKQDDDANMTLAQLKKKPNSKPRRDALAETLTECATSDPDGFGADLKQHVERVASDDSTVGTLIGQIIAGKVTVVDVMYGDINM